MLAGEHSLYLKDVSEVFTDKTMMNKIKNIRLLSIHAKEETNFLISVMDIVKAIDKTCPGNTVSNLGESDIVIEYSPKKIMDNPFVKWAKIIFVVIVLSVGSATAIMSFHSDAQMPAIFQHFYYIFFNEKVQKPSIIDIPYSIGIAVGIIIFFNHFGGRKITKDPTPIEVEMSHYEQEVTETMVDMLNAKQAGDDSNGTA